MGTVNPSTIVVTGANGFLGKVLTGLALQSGHRIRTITRTHGSFEAMPWYQHERLEPFTIDLGAPQARSALDAALIGVDCVVHAASATGDDKAHARDTVLATQTLIDAMTARPAPPRLVLISSLSVYNYEAIPSGRQVDETTPLEPEPDARDAYCRAKLYQEALARRAAQRAGLTVFALRPGPIVGPGRQRTARLGFTLGPLLVMPGGAAPLPFITVEDCAALVLRATTAAPGPSDFRTLSGHGGFVAINLVGKHQPAQLDYARQIAADGWPGHILRVPLRLARAPALLVSLVRLVMPALTRSLPNVLSLPSFDARFKALRYSRARAEDRLAAFSPCPAIKDTKAASTGYEAP